MPKIELLNCPFCGKLETLRMIYVPSEKHELVYHVVCDAVNGGCGASTGWNHETPEEAANEWNTRASGWIPCSERMPDDDVDVLVYDDGILIARYNSNEEYTSGWMESFECYPLTNVTHWIPLPQSPEVINNVD
jgi:hypothetical protein